MGWEDSCYLGMVAIAGSGWGGLMELYILYVAVQFASGLNILQRPHRTILPCFHQSLPCPQTALR